MPDLTEAADTVAELERYLSDVAYYCGPDPSTIHGVQEKLRRIVEAAKVLVKFANSYAAELDSTPVDEEWLRENHDGQNRLETYKVYQIGPCDIWHDEQHWVAAYRTVIYCNPSRGLVRTLKRIGGGM